MNGVVGRVVDLLAPVVGWLSKRGLMWYPVKVYRERVDEKLWRGSRLSESQYREMVAMGFTDVVSFCEEVQNDTHEAAAAGLVSHVIPVVDNTIPDPGEVERFLRIVSDAKGKVYCHCQAGKGRTGVFVACYRVAVNGWSIEDAMAEAERHGMGVPAQAVFVKSWSGPR